MKIATILLNYNSSADCRKCIGYLQKQKNIEQEIIVVDNCSREEERVAAKSICEEAGATFIASNRNGGYNAGNNIGLRYAAEKGYEFALIANPDVEFPQEDYIERLLQPMTSDKEIVVCGSDIITPTGVHQNPKHRGKDTLFEYFWWIKGFFHFAQKDVPQEVDSIKDYFFSKECKCLNGCCFIISISFIKNINFFDEKIFLYGEEQILGAIVDENKKKMYYNANTYAIHNHKKSKEGSRSFCFKHWRNSMIYGLYRYSKMPLYKKFIAQLSIELYFIALKISYLIKQK